MGWNEVGFEWGSSHIYRRVSGNPHALGVWMLRAHALGVSFSAYTSPSQKTFTRPGRVDAQSTRPGRVTRWNQRCTFKIQHGLGVWMPSPHALGVWLAGTPLAVYFSPHALGVWMPSPHALGVWMAVTPHFGLFSIINSHFFQCTCLVPFLVSQPHIIRPHLHLIRGIQTHMPRPKLFPTCDLNISLKASMWYFIQRTNTSLGLTG